MKGIQTSESHNCHPVTLNLPVRSLYQRPPLVSLQCLCPVPHLAAQAQRAPVQVALIAVRLRHHQRAAHSHLPIASSPETSSSASTSRSTSPELLEMERSFNSLLVGTRDHQSHPVTRSQMDNLRDQQQRIAVLKQVASQPQYQPRPVSVPPVANMPLPPYPRRRPSDKGSMKQVQAENANAPCKSSDSGTDRLQDIQEEPRRRIGPSRVKELAKVFMPTSDEEENSRVNNRTRRKKLFDPKKEEESEK